MDEIRIITDGACRGNPGPGGWAALIIDGETYTELGGSEPQITTNNRMELRAVLEALRRVPRDAAVVIVTDSRYVLDGATRWLPMWKVRDWFTHDKRAIEHRDLWEPLDRLLGQRTRWEHVRGHTGHPDNERANALAQAYAHGRTLPARVSAAPAVAQSLLPAGNWPAYLSLVRGQLARHATWEECKARVHGVAGARFKKCSSQAEALATLAAWEYR